MCDSSLYFLYFLTTGGEYHTYLRIFTLGLLTFAVESFVVFNRLIECSQHVFIWSQFCHVAMSGNYCVFL